MRTLLLPREHGTYGELIFPLLSALMLGGFTRTSCGLAVLAAGGFLAHEGFVVLLGTRGARALRSARPAAWRSVATFGAVAAAGAAAAWPGMTTPSASGLAAAALLSGAAIMMAWLGKEHTLGGELLAALALTSWCVPAALAGGVPVREAITVWTIWVALYSMATCAVHGVIAGARRRSRGPVTTLLGPVTARRLRDIGWSIVALSAVTLAIVVLVFR